MPPEDVEKGGNLMSLKESHPKNESRPKIKSRRIISLVVLLAFFIIAGAGIGYVAGAIFTMPDYNLENITGDLSSIIIDKNGLEATTLRTDKNRVVLSPEEIPQVIKDAIVAIEDQRFYQHKGIDFIRLGGAIIANLTKGYGAEGGSTITQQLVKQAILENPEKTMKRKIQEAIIALQIERKYKKDEILAFYLNNIYYGHSAWSLQTAAQTYFGKDAKDLDLAEAAMLAGVINRPGSYSPYLNMENAKKRQATVLNRMVEMGSITAQQAEAAKAEPLQLAGLKSGSYQYQSFLDYVVEEASRALGLDDSEISKLYTSGYRIYTTMDSKAQLAIEKIYADDNNFPAGQEDKIVQSAAVVLDPHSGEIRVLIGGRKIQGERLFNRAVYACRQPGSALKPVAVYAPALELGYSPATVLDDFPMEYHTPQGPKSFANVDNRYRGLVSIRTAIQHSINTVAVKMLQTIGVSEGFNFAKKLGITTLVESGTANDLGLSLALGGLTKGVSPLELTAAYAVFANQGFYIKPHAIKRIEDKEGNILYEHRTEKIQVMSAQSAYLLTDMLRSVIQSGTGTRAQLDRPAAGKTGTTSYNVDAWFVGYSPNLAGTVWLGYDQAETMRNVYGSTCAPLWSKVMAAAHQDIPVSSFPVPPGITALAVDYKSGLLPSELTPPEYVVTELFNGNNVPAEISNVWVQQYVCAESGELLTNNCRYPISKVFLQRPVPWSGDIAPEDAALELPDQYCSIHGGTGAFTSVNGGLKLQGAAIPGEKQKITGVKLYWFDPAPEKTTSYRIYRSTQANAPLTDENLLAELAPGTNNWQDIDLPGHGTYYYRVIAISESTPVFSNELIIQQSASNNNGRDNSNNSRDNSNSSNNSSNNGNSNGRDPRQRPRSEDRRR